MGWINFVKVLRSRMVIPSFSSPFYYVPLIILVLSIVGIFFLNKKMNDKAYKYTLLGVWIAMLVLELFKQILVFYIESGETLVVDYNFSCLPLHICSAALYILPCVIFITNNKIRAPFEIYYAICLLVGGLFGTIIPTFVDIIYLNVQTTAYHILLSLSAILIGLRSRHNLRINTLGEAFIIYAFFFLLAILANWLIPTYAKEFANFWGISWLYESPVPLLNKLWAKAPYPVYLLVYIHLHLAASLIVYCLLSLIYNRHVTFKVDKTNKKKVRIKNR